MPPEKKDQRDMIRYIQKRLIPKNKTNLTFSPFSLFVSFGESGESVKIVRSFFSNGINDKISKLQRNYFYVIISLTKSNERW